MNLNKDSHFFGILSTIAIASVAVIAFIGSVAQQNMSNLMSGFVGSFIGAAVAILFAILDRNRTERRKRNALCTATLIEARTVLDRTEFVVEYPRSQVDMYPVLPSVAVEQLYENLDLIDAEAVYAVTSYRNALQYYRDATTINRYIPEGLAAGAVSNQADNLIAHLLRVGAIDHNQTPPEKRYRARIDQISTLHRERIEGSKRIHEFFEELSENPPTDNKPPSEN